MTAKPTAQDTLPFSINAVCCLCARVSVCVCFPAHGLVFGFLVWWKAQLGRTWALWENLLVVVLTWLSSYGMLKAMFLSRIIIQEIVFPTVSSDGWHFWTLLELGSIFSYLPISYVFHSYLWDKWKIWFPEGIKSSLFVIIYWESVLPRPWGWVLEGATEDPELKGLGYGGVLG